MALLSVLRLNKQYICDLLPTTLLFPTAISFYAKVYRHEKYIKRILLITLFVTIFMNDLGIESQVATNKRTYFAKFI
jgi:hypothetical protein